MNYPDINKSYKCVNYTGEIVYSYKYGSYSNSYYSVYTCPYTQLPLYHYASDTLPLEKGVCKCCDFVDSSAFFKDRFNFVTDFIMEVCGFAGLYILVGFAILFFRERSLWTSYGVVCIFQAIFDFILLALIAFTQTPVLIFYDFSYYFDLNSILAKYDDFVIGLDTYYPFLFFTTKTISILMRVYKSVILFWALYFPISFKLKLNIKLTIKVCILTFIIVIALFLPQPIIENAKYIRYGIYHGIYYGIPVCTVNIFTGYYFILEEPCSAFYFYFDKFSEGFLILFCVVLDILGIIRFRQIYSNNSSLATSNSHGRTKQRQQKIMLIQNGVNVISILISFIPVAISSFPTPDPVPDYVNYCQEIALLDRDNIPILMNSYTPFHYTIQQLNRRSVRHSIGHLLDGIFTLYLQSRLAKANKGEITVTTVQPINSNLGSIHPQPNRRLTALIYNLLKR